ncbi:hypothetical protein [Hyphobacterium sp.]|uniref:hypothetical protein n=1 Tax=Hyphobacterium sp. TaxID=2004662 RepID=UPI003BA8720D
MRIKGLDSFAKKMKNLEKTVAALDGDLAKVSFDPFDPQSIELAIKEMEAEIDARVSGGHQDKLTENVVSALKEQGRTAILERAAKARLEAESSDDE